MSIWLSTRSVPIGSFGVRVKLGSTRVDFHIAQINVARAVAPLDGPQLTEFMALLDPVNALADSSPGFVWRLQTDGGNATDLRVYDDDRVIVNMSVWESIEALWDFVYRSGHLDVMRRRREWFERFDAAWLALWWLPAGTVPSLDDGLARLAALEADGPTPFAFTFKQRFAPEPVAA
jgi:hypothetical protein